MVCFEAERLFFLIIIVLQDTTVSKNLLKKFFLNMLNAFSNCGDACWSAFHKNVRAVALYFALSTRIALLKRRVPAHTVITLPASPHRLTSAESFPAGLIRVSGTVSAILGIVWPRCGACTQELAHACHVIRECLHTPVRLSMNFITMQPRA